jgi:hypothetical protein
VRRGLKPSDLGDLFDQPLTAVLSMAMPDGSVFSRPVWHRFVGGQFQFEIPAGDRKIAMLERDPRATVVLAEDAFPYRAIEVRGRIQMSAEDYRAIGTEMCRRFVPGVGPSDADRRVSQRAARHDRLARAGRDHVLGLRRRGDDAARHHVTFQHAD